MEKSAGIELELKDLDSNKGTALIQHAVYGSIDRAKDIAHKGMFTKSWNETKAAGIGFYLNHDSKHKLGRVLNVYDDDKGAYTEVKFGNWTEAKDTLEQASEGVLEGASFGYVTEKKDYSTIKGQRIRNLREVRHGETSLLQTAPCHPDAGIISLNKAFNELELKQLSTAEQSFLKQLLLNDQNSIEQLVQLMATIQPESDLYTWLGYQLSSRADRMSSIMSQLKWSSDQMNSIKAYVDKVESYSTKAKASDESIITLQNSLQEYKQIISDYDTAITQLATEPVASDDEIETMLLRAKILLAS